MRFACILAAGLAFAPCAFAGDLTVSVQGVRNDKGQIMIGLYAKGDKWPDGKAFREVVTPAHQGETVYVFKDIPPGAYAISALHDENNSGDLDKTMIGLPKEGFALSNDAEPGLSSPPFSACSFEIGNGPARAVMHIQYWSSTR